MKRWLFGLLVVCFLASPASAQMLQGIVGDSNEGTNGGSATFPTVRSAIVPITGGAPCNSGCTASFSPSPTLAGDTIAIEVVNFGNTANSFTVTGATCTPVVNSGNSGAGISSNYTAWLTCPNVGVVSSLTFTASNTDGLGVVAWDVTGVAASSLDATVGNNNASGNTVACNLTTTAANDLLIIAGWGRGGSSDAYSGGYTSDSFGAHVQNAASPGVYNSTLTMTSASQASCAAIALKP